jgi:hypothetical protein
MKLDLNFLITGLDGNPISEKFDHSHVGAIVANALAYVSKPVDGMSALKRMTIAQELYKKNPVEIDKEEAKGIKTLISIESGFPPITVNLVHEAINKLLE